MMLRSETDPPAIAEDPSSRVLQLLVQLTIDDKVMDVLFSARQLQLLSCRQMDKKLCNYRMYSSQPCFMQSHPKT